MRSQAEAGWQALQGVERARAGEVQVAWGEKHRTADRGREGQVAAKPPPVPVTALIGFLAAGR